MGLDFDVVELPPADAVAEGETAPDFTRPLVRAEYWEDVSLSALLEEGPVCLLFHPMDGAFPATYVWQEVRERGWGTDGAVQVVGCSISTPYEHKTTIRERDLEAYALFSDPGNGVAESYGVAHDLDGMAGVSEARPAVYCIDRDRTVRYAWVAEQWPDFPDYDAVEGALDGL
ncbi:MAG: redoxin domain-containing protein [Halobacteriaceae archaeon]